MYEVAAFMMWLIATDSGNTFALISMALMVYLVVRHEHS